MRLIAMFLMVLSLGLFSLGCAKPAGETSTETPPAAGGAAGEQKAGETTHAPGGATTTPAPAPAGEKK
jgi:hypothetical protein